MQEVIKGLDVLIKINGKVVGGQRNASLEISVETMDATHKLSGGWSEKIAGLMSWTPSLDGIYVTDDEGLGLLEKALFDKKAVDLVFFQGVEGDTYSFGYEGKAILTSLSYEAGQDDVVSYTVGSEGTGKLTPLRGTEVSRKMVATKK